MSFGACLGLTDTMTSHHSSVTNVNHHESNKYIGESFFQGKNYRSILECLDGGYDIAMNVVRSMREFLDLLKHFADSLTAYTKKWTSQINEQPLLSSYNTTKNAQLQTVETAEKHSKHVKELFDTIQQVIDEYKNQINKMYPRAHFSTAHKHHRTEEMKRLFKSARLSLQNVLNELEDLTKQKKQASDAVSTAEKEYQDLDRDSSTNESRLARADEKITQRKKELRLIERNITAAQKSRKEREEEYRKEATVIFHQCQDLERERLDQIKQTLMKFSQAVYSSEYSSKLGTIYEKLFTDIKTLQDSDNDLNHWAQTYGIHTTDLPRTNSNHNSENTVLPTTQSRTTTKSTAKSNGNDDDDELSATINTTVPSKSKTN